MIDYAIISAILYGLTTSGVFSLSGRSIVSFNNGFHFNFTLYAPSYIASLLYYLTFEATLGRTPGKFATRSFVINEYANKPDIGAIIARSFSRWIPFDALSCLGERGWHDKISKTYVVTKDEWSALRKALYGEDGFSEDSEEILDV